MIYGIGVDVCDIRRIRATFERNGEKLIRRILGEDEQVVFRRRYNRLNARGVRYLATRFSAKEAFAKAIGTGIRSPMSWPLVQILNEPSGKPAIVLSGKLKVWCSERISLFHVSVSDESDYATSTVIAEKI